MERPGLQAVSEGSEERAEDRLTIDELAHQAGMSVRNVRAHQARGLLPPPEVVQRTGYYGPEHLARLRLIQELQAEGFNLRGIERLLERTPGPSERLLGFKRAISEPFETEQPELLSEADLEARFGPEAEAISKAVRLGLLVELGEGRYEAPSPSLLAAAEEVTKRGVTLSAALSTVRQVQRHCRAASRSFVELFVKEIWEPFEAAGHPEERWPEVLESIDRLRPLASEAMLAVFQAAMTREVESAFGRELGNRSRSRSRGRGRGR
jgi:DNA-binding transcriptional MerR regulator